MQRRRKEGVFICPRVQVKQVLVIITTRQARPVTAALALALLPFGIRYLMKWDL